MLLGLVGFTANGVSFWAVVSRLTLTTETDPEPRALKLGVPRVVMGASRQAAKTAPAPRAAHNEPESRMQDLRGNEPLKIDPLSCRLATRNHCTWRPAPSFLSSLSVFGPGSSVGRAAD